MTQAAWYTLLPKTIPPPGPDPEPPPPEQTWVFVANEKEAFTLTETTTLRYGLEPNWIIKTVEARSFAVNEANNTFFGGDPVPQQVKRIEKLVISGGGSILYPNATNFQITFGDARIIVDWTQPTQAGLTGFDLSITRPVTGEEVIALGLNSDPYTITTNINNGSSYSLKIRAKYGTNLSAWSNVITGTPSASALNPPRNVVASDGDNGINVNFDNPLSGSPTSYQIVTRNTSTNAETTTNVTTTQSRPVAVPATNGVQYGVKMRAVYSSGNSAYTSEVFVTPVAPPAPTFDPPLNFSAVFGNTEIVASWDHPASSGRTGYEIVVTKPVVGDIVYDIVSTATTARFSGLTNGSVHSIKIRTKYGTNYSQFSSTLTGIPSAPAAGVSKLFTPHQVDRPNPERGVTHIHMVYSSFGTNQPRALGTVGTSTRLVQFRYVWHDFLTSDISTTMLNHLIDDLRRAREQGVKVIYWPSYWSNGPVYPGMTLQYGGQAALQAKALGKTDTTEAWIKRLWDQVAPILNANKDVIAWVQIGSMGAWGEGNKSSNGLDYDVSNPDAAVKRIFEHVLSKLDVEIKVAGRYVPALRTMFGSAAVTAAEAHTSVTKARIGPWDDFAGALYGQGDRDWLAAHNLYFPQHGEGVPGSYSYNSIGGVNGLNFFRSQRWTAFQPFGGDFLKTWQEEFVYDDILRGLGYRFELHESRIPSSVGRGQTLNVILKLKNAGFANVNNLRRAEIVLRNKATNQYTRLVGITDIRKGANRFPDPGVTKDCTLSASIPNTLPAGNYQVLVNLPDPNFLNPANANQRKYSIEIMSNNVYDPNTAYNAVGDVVIS